MENKWFRKLPGFQKSTPGLEWVILKKIPKIFTYGTLIPLLFLAWSNFERKRLYLNDFSEDKIYQNLEFITYGVISAHWCFTLMLALLCFIIMVMKGPAYVADAYYLNDKDKL